MKLEKISDFCLDGVINKLASYSSIYIVIFFSILASILSFTFVYILTNLHGDAPNDQLFKFSIIIPLITTPILVSILIRFSKHLKHYKKHLEQEIQESKEKDVMLFEQARFVLMGEMMANISHQWKQPLNTINLAVLSAKTSNSSGEELYRYFDIMEDNVNYLASTIDDFMSFFDKRTHLEIRNIEDIVKEVRSITEASISDKNIYLEINIDDSAKDVMIASSISQVIINLLNNSKDAFTKESKNKNISVLFSVKDHLLEIACCDNGSGVPQEIQDKIFDPYFTTKDKAQGTGLGLYMSKQILQKLFNGSLTISSQRNTEAGFENETCFYIDIPSSDKCIIKESQK